MKVVIVEDEPLVQQRIARFTQAILADKLDKLSTFATLEDAEDYLAQAEVDVLLLDLNLQGQNGFDLLKHQVARAFHTIVISAYAEKAIDAFDYGVLDFIAKPFTQARLQKALERITDNTLRNHYGCRYLSVKKATGIDLVAIADIAYIQADGHYCQLTLKDVGAPLLHSKNIESIQALLPQQFERIHRSYLVNMNLVQRIIIESGSRYQAELKNGELLPISRGKFPDIKAKFDSHA